MKPDPHIELRLHESDIVRIVGALELSAAHVEMMSRTMAAFGGKDQSKEAGHLREIKQQLRDAVQRSAARGGGA